MISKRRTMCISLNESIFVSMFVKEVDGIGFVRNKTLCTNKFISFMLLPRSSFTLWAL